MEREERLHYARLFAQRPRALPFPKLKPELPSFAVPYSNRVWFYLFSPDPYVEGQHHYAVYPSRPLKDGEEPSAEELLGELMQGSSLRPTGLLPFLLLKEGVLFTTVQSKEREGWEKQWRRTLRCFLKALFSHYRLWLADPHQNWWVRKGGSRLPFGIAGAHFGEERASFHVVWGGGKVFQWLRALPSPLLELQLKTPWIPEGLPPELAKSRPFGLDASIKAVDAFPFRGGKGCRRAEELKLSLHDVGGA